MGEGTFFENEDTSGGNVIFEAILKQKYNIKTTPQTLSKWRLKLSTPRGRNQIIFDHFKPDGNLWQPLQ